MPILVESLQLLAIADVKLILTAHMFNGTKYLSWIKVWLYYLMSKLVSNTLTHENVTIDVQLGLGNAKDCMVVIYPMIMCVLTHHIEHGWCWLMKFIVIKIGGSTLSDMHPSIINNIKHLRSNNILPYYRSRRWPIY